MEERARKVHCGKKQLCDDWGTGRCQNGVPQRPRERMQTGEASGVAPGEGVGSSFDVGGESGRFRQPMFWEKQESEPLTGRLPRKKSGDGREDFLDFLAGEGGVPSDKGKLQYKLVYTIN